MPCPLLVSVTPFKPMRAVITGIGVVSPIGSSPDEFLRGLLAGEDGSGPLTRFQRENFPVGNVCEVKGFDPQPAPDPFIQFGLEAARQALADSRADFSSLDPYRFGVVVSSSKGGMTSFERGDWADFPPGRLNSHIAQRWGARGPMNCVIAACATGTYSVMQGVRWIEQGDADFVLAGASDASLTPLMLAGYSRMGVYAKNGMCPYDARRTGFLVGEGAGVVALEAEAHAQARGAEIYGVVEASAFSTDPFRPTAFDPDADELAFLLQSLLRKARLSPRDLDYVNTHGTSTREGDRYETDQIKKAFGREAYDLSYSSTKSMVGHMLGASGAVELIACLLAMKHDFIPPTIHYECPDPSCDLNYTPNQIAKKPVRRSCSISLGFGGHLSAIIVAS